MIPYIIISIIYIIALVLVQLFRKSSKDKPASISPDIIAVPGKYIINIIDCDSEIEHTEFADLTLKLRDIMDSPSHEKQSQDTSEVIHFKDIDFNSLVTINAF